VPTTDTLHMLAGWLTVSDFAGQIGRGARTVARYIGQGMPCIRVGRSVYIDPLQARAWFEAGCPPPKPSRGRRAA
jgi:hypothetical protein